MRIESDGPYLIKERLLVFLFRVPLEISGRHIETGQTKGANCRGRFNRTCCGTDAKTQATTTAQQHLRGGNA